MTNQGPKSHIFRTVPAVIASALLTSATIAQGVSPHRDFPPEEIARWTVLLDEHVRPKEFFRQMQEPDPIVASFVYVQFRPSTFPDTINLVNAAVGVQRVTWQSRIIPGLFQVQVPAGRERQAILTYLDRDDVLFAEPMYECYPVDTIPNDPAWDELWGMVNAMAPQAWDTYTGRTNLRIAVVDTGINYSHEDLATNIWVNPGEIPGNWIDDDGNGFVDDVFGYDFFNDDEDPMDEDGVGNCNWHGSHVAGTIGAVGNNGVGVVGVNWTCDLIAIKAAGPVFDRDEGWVCRFRNTVQALEYALNEGTRVSNHSWGGSSFSNSMFVMIIAAQGYNHLFVAAAGNGGEDGVGDNNDLFPHYPSSYNAANIIAVAAIDEDDEKAGFSNYGPGSVDLGAPGVGVLSTVGGGSGMYGYRNGTSMATPHVAGAVGLLQAAHNNTLPWQWAKDRVMGSVRQIPALQGITVTGGTLNIDPILDTFANLDAGNAGNGSPQKPFNNLTTALSWTPSGFPLAIYSSTDNWTGTINQPITITAIGGPVTIGR